MYPELYPELEARDRKLKGFALSLAGSFVFMVTAVGAVAFSSQWMYLGVSALSLGAVTLVYFAHRSRAFFSQVVLLICASATLAAETGAVGFLLHSALAAGCAILTLGGCLVAARGIHDVEAIAAIEPFAPKRRREMTIEQKAGGE